MDKGITNINLWIAILSSSFVTAIITIIAGWYRHKSEFKNEYYSTIMNKRLTALEHINVITFELSILTNLGTKVVPKFCSSKEDYDRLIVYLGNVNALNLWLTGEMSKKLTEFNVFCVNRIDNEILKSVESNELIDYQYQQQGLKLMEEIRDFRKTLTAMSEKELRNLYQVKRFLRRKKSNYFSFGIEKAKFLD